MLVGPKIRKIRLDVHMTQKEVAQATGLAISYLSRLENGKINPSVETLNKIADALDVPIVSFFDAEQLLETGDQCPVSLSGRCILDHIFVAHGRKPKTVTETYTREQLEILRLCNYLLHSGNKRVQVTLITLMRSLVQLTEKG